MAGLAAIGSLAARCWGEIQLDLRSEVFDEDDLGALHSRYMPFSRTQKIDWSAFAFEGMDQAPLAEMLGEMVEEVVATDCYAACLGAVAALRQHGGRRALGKFRNRVYDRLDEVYAEATNLFAVGVSARALIGDIYSTAPPGVREAGIAVQAHNELIQAVLWTMLGIAGEWSEPVLLTELPPAARLRADGRHHDLTVTTKGSAMGLFGHPPFPLAIQAGTPVDGIYLIRAQLVQLLFTSLVDVSGRRLGGLEAAP